VAAFDRLRTELIEFKITSETEFDVKKQQITTIEEKIV